MREGEKEWRSEVREMIEKEVMNKLDYLKRVIESLSKDRRTLRLEDEELRRKLDEDRKEIRIEEENWKKARQEMEIEIQVEEALHNVFP